jgi:hypothetical protein
MKKTLLAVAAAVMAAAPAFAPAMAQDASQPPVFGSTELTAGFDRADGHQRRFRAGGPNDAGRLPGRCTGNVGTPPDYNFTYTAGSHPLVISSHSMADTALVILAPDGRWHCDDDSFGDLDAEYRFDRPQSGTYKVWVAVVNMREADATLAIRER